VPTTARAEQPAAFGEGVGIEVDDRRQAGRGSDQRGREDGGGPVCFVPTFVGPVAFGPNRPVGLGLEVGGLVGVGGKVGPTPT